MNKFFKVFFLIALSVIITNCEDDEEASVSTFATIDFDEQYNTDQAKIVTYLKTHSITFDADMNPTYADVPLLDASSLWGTNPTVHGLKILEREVIFNSKSYVIYFVQGNKGSGQQPCNVDQVMCSYSGKILDTDVVFDYSNNQQTAFLLSNVVRGWGEIFPQFMTAGSSSIAANGSINYNDFGAGVMFLPSGFAYFNQTPSALIPSYSTLIFSFKLFNLKRMDQDGDGILSVDEDIIKDYYITSADDTDGDGIVDAADTDDDGDRVFTIIENRRPGVLDVNGKFTQYPFQGTILDDPLTTNIDETQGVPDCSGNYTSTTRKRKYLDASCQ